jgi:hypothetical protein
LESELEKMPVQGKVNTPDSGTYGEKAALDGLKKSLPPMGSGGRPEGGNGAAGAALSPEPPIMPVPPPSGTPSPQQPAGVPSALLGPTGRPMEPVTAPPTQPLSFPVPERSAAESRLEVLITLANDPRVSEQTREWAQLWVKTLVR